MIKILVPSIILITRFGFGHVFFACILLQDILVQAESFFTVFHGPFQDLHNSDVPEKNPVF